MTPDQLYRAILNDECASYLAVNETMTNMQQAKAEMNAREAVFMEFANNMTQAAYIDAKIVYTDYEQNRNKETLEMLKESAEVIDFEAYRMLESVGDLTPPDSDVAICECGAADMFKLTTGATVCQYCEKEQ